MSANIDLSGFPVVRIDQIPLIDSDTLVQAQKDVKSLIASLLAESDTIPPMVHYLRKQNEVTSAELMNRLAQERINSLLNGATTLLNNDRSKYLLDDDDEIPPVKASTENGMKTPTKSAKDSNSTTPAVPSFQPLPLPSEVRSKRVSSLVAPARTDIMNTSASTANTGTELSTSPLNRSKSTPVGIAMASSRSVSERDRGGRRMDAGSNDEFAASESSPQRRRPLSGDIRPSKRSQDFINNNFGNLFIVAGEGRRRRPLVKKAPAESIEVIKARERLERRKAAMQRLLDRKEERQKMQLAKREAKRAALREAELAAESNTNSALDSPSTTTVTSSTDHAGKKASLSGTVNSVPRTKAKPPFGKEKQPQQDSSSGSESVSGGDDDGEMQVVVDEKMVQALVTAEQQDATIPVVAMQEDVLTVVVTEAAEIATVKSAGKAVGSPKATPDTAATVTNGAGAAAQGKPRRVRPAVEAARGAQNKTLPTMASSSSKMHTNPNKTLNSRSTDSVEPVPSKTNTVPKRKSAYRTEPSPDTATAGSAVLDRISQIAVSSTLADNSQGLIASMEAKTSNTEVTENADGTEGTEDVEVSQVITEQDLIADFEAKNFAALQSLRNMKLKKEQQRLSSVKATMTETPSLPADEDNNAPKHQDFTPHQSTEPFIAIADANYSSTTDVNMLTQSVDSGIYPFFPRAERSNSVSSEESEEKEKEQKTEPPPPAAEQFEAEMDALVVPPRPLSRVALSVAVPVMSSRPSSRMVRESTVNVSEGSYIDSLAGNVSHSADRNAADVGAVPVRSASPPINSNRDAYSHAHSRPISRSSHPNLNTAKSIDLSQTALAMSIDASALLSPEPSHKSQSFRHTLWGPRDPVVAALLAGVKNSALLYVADGVYCCERSAEDLPGLSAWKLVSIVDECANWVVNLNKYTETQKEQQESEDGQKSDAFMERALLRKSVSLGLLVLLLDCEDLLLGSVHLYNSEHFTTLWEEYIRLFDLKAESISLQFGPQALFTQVGVCGNTHTVCRKLENILKTIFTTQSAAEARLHRKLHAKEGDIPTHIGRLTIPANEITGEGRVFVENTGASAYRGLDNTKIGSLLSVHSPQSSMASLDYSHATPRNMSNTNNANNTNITQDHLPDDPLTDSDDDTPIIPTYTTNLGSEEQNIEESAFNIAERFVRKTSATGLVANDTDSAPHTNGTPNNSNNEASVQSMSLPTPITNPAVSSAQKKTPTSIKAEITSTVISSTTLTEYYPTIGSIFPAAYNQTATAKPAEDGSAAARSLLQCMQVQCKIYEEWLEVMSDYSTVFCDDRRGVAEHYHGSHSNDNNNNDADGSSTVYKGGTRSLHFRVKSARSEVNNIVSDVFNNFLKQWEELPSGLGLGLSWNILWTWSKPRIKLNNLLVWQKVNHYPDSKELTRKDLLKKNIQRYTVMGGKGGENFNIMPLTFLLPHEYTAFVQAFTTIESQKYTPVAPNDVNNANTTTNSIAPPENNEIQNFWILKPLGMSRGRGISLVKDLSQIAYSVSSVVQRYIERPLCLKGYKFDLRLYVVVTSFRPLEAFIYRDGFARVSTHQYSLSPADTENKFIHLTNSSIQVQNTEGPTKDSPLQTEGEDEQDTGGTKISLLGNNGLWKRLQEFGIDIPSLWQSISSLVIKSLVMVDDKIAHQPNCFELFGYDVLVDADLRPWLLEVNASPSLARPSPLDVRVKNAMIKDIISLLDVAPYDRAAVLRVLQRRLQQIAKNRVHAGKNDPELESDLKDILGEYKPRRYGELPRDMGNYELLAPNTKEYERVLKLKRKIIKS